MIIKRALMCLSAVLPLLSPTAGDANNYDDRRIRATLTLTGFGGGTEDQVGNIYRVRDLIVLATVSGDLKGSDEHRYNANINVVNGRGNVWGTFSMEITEPCVGQLAGSFHGKTRFTTFQQDDAKALAHGSGGCAGKKLIADVIETSDGVFAIDGELKD